MTEMSPEAQQLSKAQEAEYGTYVATEDIDLGGTRAFNTGDPVPVGHVDRGVVRSDQVAKANTKAAARAQADNPTSPVEKKEK